MQNQTVSHQTGGVTHEAARLPYLDWLRVIAIPGVFLFHILCVFIELDFYIKNAELSADLSMFVAFFFPWGMPLIFFVAGAASWFALQRRPPRQYVRDRFSRLLIPYIVGSVLLSPIIYYVEWVHEIETGVIQGSFLELVRSLSWEANPRVFAAVGNHLWFLGFLFIYSLLSLPLFRWLRQETGQRFVSRLARLCEFRGGILLFLLPLLIVRLSLQSFYPQYLNWTDFVSFLTFYILGYLLLADKRFIQAIRRDWLIALIVGIAAFVAGAAISIATDEFDLELVPRAPLDWVWWACFTACSWCWTVVILFVGTRFLNSSNKWLQYSREIVMPFYVFHQPVLVVVAYYVVQWDMELLPKLLAMALGAFAVTLGLCLFVVERVDPLRLMFGMKTRQLNR